MPDRTSVRAALRRRFEIGDHPLRYLARLQLGPTLAELSFETATGEPVRGLFLRPDSTETVPAVLVIHAHGGRYDIGCAELTEGRPALPAPLGPALLERGIASLCLDLPCFGTRAGQTEDASAKAALWRGRSLAGQMIGELSAQLDWLAVEPGIDAARIGVYGLSMGATLGYWLAGVDTRITALAQLCCLADIEALIRSGAHDLHGHYLTVPGLPGLARNGEIAGLTAPRPQLVCLGAQDPLTPPDALRIALDDLRAGYADAPDRLEVIVDPASGHCETPQMRARVLDFFSRNLGQLSR